MNIPKITIPRFKLPKLPAKILLTSLVAIPGLTILARAKIVCGLIVSALTPLQKVYGALSNLSSTNATDNIKKTLQSVKGQISKQVSNIVGAAVSNVTGAVTTIGAAAKGFIDTFKNAGDSIKKQKESIKNIITDEIDCIKNSVKTNSTSSIVESTIKQETQNQVNSLSNKDLKDLSEDPKKRQEFENMVTENVIDKSAQNISNSLISNYTQQVVAVDKLAIL